MFVELMIRGQSQLYYITYIIVSSSSIKEYIGVRGESLPWQQQMGIVRSNSAGCTKQTVFSRFIWSQVDFFF